MTDFIGRIMSGVPLWVSLPVVTVLGLLWMYFFEVAPFKPAKGESEWQKKWRKHGKK